MDTSLQRADIWKRISAFLCDAVCIIFVSCLAALLLTLATGINGHAAAMNERRDAIIKEAGYLLPSEVDPVVDENGNTVTPKDNVYPDSTEDVENLTEEEKARYQATEKAIMSDEIYLKEFKLFVSITLAIATSSILFAFLIFEILIPLLFKNGQTLGKKVFGVAVMRADGVRIPAALLFLRAIVCKFTLETMVPVMALIGALLFQWWITALILIIGIFALQIILFLSTKDRTPIHDICTYTVAVDMASQKIFNSVEEKAEYIAKIQRERAEDNRDY